MGLLGDLDNARGLRRLGCYILGPIGFYVHSPRVIMESCSARPMYCIWQIPSGGIYHWTCY